jgi:hypothetical protein
MRTDFKRTGCVMSRDRDRLRLAFESPWQPQWESVEQRCSKRSINPRNGSIWKGGPSVELVHPWSR